MDFIYKQNDFVIGVCDFFDYGFQVFFEFFFVFCIGNQSSDIKGQDFFFVEVFGYIVLNDLLGNVFYDGGFFYVCFVDQDRVVFFMLVQDMEYVVDFFILFDDGVEFVGFCLFVEVDGEFFQRIVVIFCVLVSDFLFFVQFFDGGVKGFFCSVFCL